MRRADAAKNLLLGYFNQRLQTARHPHLHLVNSVIISTKNQAVIYIVEILAQCHTIPAPEHDN